MGLCYIRISFSRDETLGLVDTLNDAVS